MAGTQYIVTEKRFSEMLDNLIDNKLKELFKSMTNSIEKRIVHLENCVTEVQQDVECIKSRSRLISSDFGSSSSLQIQQPEDCYSDRCENLAVYNYERRMRNYRANYRQGGSCSKYSSLQVARGNQRRSSTSKHNSLKICTI